MNRAALQSHDGATATDKPDVLQHGIHVEPSGTSQEPPAGVGETQSLSAGTYWNLLGMRAVLNTSCTPNTILGKVFGACWHFAGTYTWRGPNTLEPVRNLLEPVRNLCLFEHLAWAKHHFPKSAIVSEPAGTLPEPVDLNTSPGPNHHLAWVPVLQYILLNKSTGDPPAEAPVPPQPPF